MSKEEIARIFKDVMRKSTFQYFNHPKKPLHGHLARARADSILSSIIGTHYELPGQEVITKTYEHIGIKGRLVTKVHKFVINQLLNPRLVSYDRKPKIEGFAACLKQGLNLNELDRGAEMSKLFSVRNFVTDVVNNPVPRASGILTSSNSSGASNILSIPDASGIIGISDSSGTIRIYSASGIIGVSDNNGILRTSDNTRIMSTSEASGIMFDPYASDITSIPNMPEPTISIDSSLRTLDSDFLKSMYML